MSEEIYIKLLKLYCRMSKLLLLTVIFVLFIKLMTEKDFYR